MGYNAIGNTTFKSAVGGYSYGAKPHAVSGVSGAITANYSYDANGNLLLGLSRHLQDV